MAEGILMTTKQIAKKLYNKGFKVKVTTDFVEVSLNRPVSTMEVEAALDYEVPILGKSGNAVMVLGQS